MFRHRLITSSAALAVLASAVAIGTSPVAATGGGSTRLISAAGTSTFRSAGLGSDGLAQPEIRSGLGGDGAAVSSNRSNSSAKNAPMVNGPAIAGVAGTSGPLQVLSSFDGLNHRKQRLANGGNQFSLEPPDQGLCAGNGFVMEIINDVATVYDHSGNRVAPITDLNTFFGYPPAIIRSTLTFGPFMTDPSCYFDKTTQRWFADDLTIETFPTSDPANHISAGDFTGINHLDLAVSQTADPTGAWTIYRTPVQDDGTQGTPNHGCTGIPPFGQRTTPTNPNACLGDYPHLGADANGIYLTTNEYSFFGNDFHGAQVYAFSKAALAALSPTVSVTQIDTHGLDNGNSGFTIWPATASGDVNSSANGGTEYFLSSNAADEAHGNGVAVGPRTSNQLLSWSLTNTSSLDSASPAIALSHTVLTVGQYSFPPRSAQKAGSAPLRDCLNNAACSTFLIGIPDPFAPNVEYALDSNDTRMQQVVFADGKLWAALDTALKIDGKAQAGIEWFVVNPSSEGGARLVNSGYVGVKRQNLTYPAVSVTQDGEGLIAFTFVGQDHYPSAAFASINADGVGPVQVAAEGAGPADGFSGYPIFNAPNPNRPRWGDYGAAVVDGRNIWIASEYIGQTCTFAQYTSAPFGSCGGTRTSLANWDTRITEVQPAGGD